MGQQTWCFWEFSGVRKGGSLCIFFFLLTSGSESGTGSIRIAGWIMIRKGRGQLDTWSSGLKKKYPLSLLLLFFLSSMKKLTSVVVQLLRTGLHHFSVHCHLWVLQSELGKHLQVNLTCRCKSEKAEITRATLWIREHLFTLN